MRWSNRSFISVVVITMFFSSSSFGADNSKIFFKAIKKGQNSKVEKMLKGGVSPNIKNKKGSPALVYAVSQREHKIVKTLLKFGAKKGIKDKKGRTAIALAKKRVISFGKIIKTLLSK